MTSRSLIQRSCVVLGFAVLSVYLFYIGKGHTLIVDTNAITINGQEFAAPDSINVSVDGKSSEEMGRAERIMVSVGGPQHTIAIDVVSGSDRKIEKRFTLPTFMDSALVSIPAILADAPAEYWVTTFIPADRDDTPAEQMQHESEAPEVAAPAAAAVPSAPKP